MTKEMLMSNNKFMRSTFLYLGPSELPTDFLPTDKADFRLSRYCLKQLTNASNLSISRYLHLEEDSSKLVSLTHTRGLAACALCTNPDVKSIGVDIEWTHRNMKEGSFKYFVTDESELKLHSPLEIWCIKEAAFKAYYPFYDEIAADKVLVLTDFLITEVGKLSGPNEAGLTYEIGVRQYQGDEFIIALSEY